MCSSQNHNPCIKDLNALTIQLKVYFFANLRDMTGKKEQTFTLHEGGCVQDLKKVVRDQFPSIVRYLPNIVTAVNQEFAFDEDPLHDGDEVAFFPPVSGGSEHYPTHVAVQESEFDLNKVFAWITLPSTGAVCMFTGIVRGVTVGGDFPQTEYLEYEAYSSMAEAKMEQVAAEIRQNWSDVEGIAIIQRVGVLMPGSPTVIIACSAAHRDTGVFEAARYGIDRLKEIVPVWKKRCLLPVKSGLKAVMSRIGKTGEYWDKKPVPRNQYEWILMEFPLSATNSSGLG